MLILIFSSAEERDAFEFLYTRYKNLMLKKAYEILQDAMLAEDAVSEAFIRIYKNMEKIEDPASNRSLAFVTTIVRNTALTILRKQVKQPVSIEEYPDREDAFDLEQNVLSSMSTEDIYRIVGSLSEELRSVFLLKYAYDYSNKEIAKLLDITVNNVTVRLFRAKKKMAEMLVKEGYAVETAE